mmetsp:Transcript_37503/g.51524  ORF Transcript_37503/g.51524 Transcript_37503/m.51524 type:complete len:164 (+) Transcript_37503:2-493(+)
MQFNGVLLGEQAVRLRQDRGEFQELRATKRQRTAAPEPEERPRGAHGKGREAYDAPEDDRPRRGGAAHGGSGAGGRPSSTARVYVGNLDFRISWQDLKDHMRQAGDVRFCDVLKDQEGRHKGCGIVEYNTEEECEIALSMLNHTELGNRAIYVKWADERSGRR